MINAHVEGDSVTLVVDPRTSVGLRCVLGFTSGLHYEPGLHSLWRNLKGVWESDPWKYVSLANEDTLRFRRPE